MQLTWLRLTQRLQLCVDCCRLFALWVFPSSFLLVLSADECESSGVSDPFCVSRYNQCQICTIAGAVANITPTLTNWTPPSPGQLIQHLQRNKTIKLANDWREPEGSSNGLVKRLWAGQLNNWLKDHMKRTAWKINATNEQKQKHIQGEWGIAANVKLLVMNG